jgi:hypothetical protein
MTCRKTLLTCINLGGTDESPRNILKEFKELGRFEKKLFLEGNLTFAYWCIQQR